MWPVPEQGSWHVMRHHMRFMVVPISTCSNSFLCLPTLRPMEQLVLGHLPVSLPSSFPPSHGTVASNLPHSLASLATTASSVFWGRAAHGPYMQFCYGTRAHSTRTGCLQFQVSCATSAGSKSLPILSPLPLVHLTLEE